MSDLERYSDISNEVLFIGALLKKPSLIINYESLVKSKYDFYDEDNKFIYDSFDLYYKTFSQEVSKTKMIVFMSKNPEREKRFSKIGGWSLISKMMQLTDENDVEHYFNVLKKYSLVREFNRKGFPTEKLVNYKKFDKMTADDILNFMSYNISNISTQIGGGKSAVILGNDAVSKIDSWLEEPDFGIEFPFPLWNTLFRGWRKKKLIIDGMLSNEGKSRKVSRMAAYIGVLHQTDCLILANEMDEDENFAMVLSTVANSPEFGFNLDIPEANILLGQYDSEEQLERIREVGRYIEENSRIHFIEMNQYSNEDIKREIKKYTLLGVEYVFYDTMKGYQTDAWDSLKQTATMLKDVANEYKVGVYASIQLTDDSINFNIEDFSSNNIANSKQIKHVCDHMLLGRRIPKSRYDKYNIVNPDWGTFSLDKDKIYIVAKVDKNRGGQKGVMVCNEVNLDRNTWTEVGRLVLSKDN